MKRIYVSKKRKCVFLKSEKNVKMHVLEHCTGCVALAEASHVAAPAVNHRCEKTIFTFFYFGHVFTFLTFFIFQTFFLILKNVGKVQSGKQISKKHFQNKSNEIDL